MHTLYNVHNIYLSNYIYIFVYIRKCISFSKNVIGLFVLWRSRLEIPTKKVSLLWNLIILKKNLCGQFI